MMYIFVLGYSWQNGGFWYQRSAVRIQYKGKILIWDMFYFNSWKQENKDRELEFGIFSK